MFGYRNISGYLVDRTSQGLVLQKIIAFAHKNSDGKWEFSFRDLRKLGKLAEALAGSKVLWLEFGEGKACWAHYLIKAKFFNLERKIDSFEKELKYAVKQ